MKKSNLFRSLVAGVTAVSLFAGAFAYFTDNDQVTNTFEIGSVKIELTEPNWDPEPEKPFVPTEVIEKDPTISNVGENDAWVYLQVEVPTANIITANEDGTRNEKSVVELFSYAINDGWTLIKTDTSAQGKVIYTYGFDTKLAPGEDTPALFDSVKFVNAIEGQGLEGNTYDIVVTAKAIQVVNTGSMQEAFEIYSNQND